jgi:hypothetical protein
MIKIRSMLIQDFSILLQTKNNEFYKKEYFLGWILL